MLAKSNLITEKNDGNIVETNWNYKSSRQWVNDRLLTRECNLIDLKSCKPLLRDDGPMHSTIILYASKNRL